jgi:hypothetical protein
LAALALGSHFFHLFARLGFLLVAEFAVFIGVEFLEHLLAHFGAFAVGFLVVLFRRLGDCRQ